MSKKMDEQVNPLERDHLLCVVLPGKLEEKTTVHGSKPVMDLLVTLCASYHLNPSDYTIEFLSANKNSISFKPNSPIGSLEAEKMVLKPRVSEEKVKRPYVPEATVRLLISYNTAHRAVLRVNPKLPLEMLLPMVCDKCEFNVETTVLLRDSESQEPLDLKKTLNDHKLREVFAKDTAANNPTDHQLRTTEAADEPAEVISALPLKDLPKKEKKQKNRGFFSLFRRKKKKNEMHGTLSAPASPGLNKQVGVGVDSENMSPTDNLRAETYKKRRAPPPPVAASQSVPSDLSTCHIERRRSAESTLRSTKRRAPPPPCANALQELREDTDVGESLNTVVELKETDESQAVNPSLSSSSSPHPSQPQPSLSSWRQSLAHLQEESDLHLPSFRGKDLCDARCALAKVLTSSVSKGALVKRLRNSTTFPRFNVFSCVSMAHECPDNEGLCAELESVLNSNLPTEEWEDPVQRRRLTTFKVVPPTKLASCDPELNVDVPDQYKMSAEDNPGSEGSPEGESNQMEKKEDPCSPDRSENASTEPSQQNQMNGTSPSPPPLPDLVSQNAPDTPLSEVGDANKTQEEVVEPEVRSEVIQSDCGDGEIISEGHVSSDDPVADMDPCADEKNTEEKLLREEKKEEEEVSFPPPPPPVFFKDDVEAVHNEVPEASSIASPQPASPTLNGHTKDLGVAQTDKSTSAMPEQPLDNTSATPSKFAQAVAMAVQRCRLQNLSKGLSPQVSSAPQGALQSPPRSTYQYGA